MKRVAVIGAGPAGCSAAITMTTLGLTVDVFERGGPEKDKPCGDAFLPDAVNELFALGITLDTFQQSGGRSFHRLDLWDDHKCIWTLPLGFDPGWIAPRAIVDQAVREIAAQVACIKYEAMVQQVNWYDGNWYLYVDGQSVQYDAVVIATGATNILSRGFGVEGRPIMGASVSLYAEYDQLEAPIFQFTGLGGAGYGWLFPLSNRHVNIGVCAVSRVPKQLRSTVTSYLQRWKITLSNRLRGGVGPFWSGTGSIWHDHRGLVSCGDAAGLVDPLTGEGISAALKSGKAAGSAISAWLLEGKDASHLGFYSYWVLESFRKLYSATPARRVWAYLDQVSNS